MGPFWGGDSVTCALVTVVQADIFHVFLKKWGAEEREANKRASFTADEHPSAVEEEVAVVPSLLASGNVVMSCLVFILLL